jgi:hypothetical protein
MENAPTWLTHARRGTGNTILVDYKKPCDGCHGRYPDALGRALLVREPKLLGRFEIWC